MALAVCSKVSALRGPVCAVRMTSRQARLASLIVFYLVIIKNIDSFCELRFMSVEKFLRFVDRCVRLA